MNLRWRISLVVLVSALAPVVATGLFLGHNIITQSRAEYTAQLSASRQATRLRVEERRAQEQRAIARLCANDLVVDRLLLDLEAGRFGPNEEQDLVQRVPPLMHALGLDVLTFVDQRRGRHFGRILASGHYPARAGARDARSRPRSESPDAAFFTTQVQTRTGEENTTTRAVVTSCLAERGRARVLIVGGHYLNDEFVTSLGVNIPPVTLQLTDAQGTLEDEIPRGGGQENVWHFTNAEGETSARLIAVANDAALQDKLQNLQQSVAIISSMAVMLSLLLGFILALGIRRPLQTLEEAATRVASGDLNTDVTRQYRQPDEIGRALDAFNHMTDELQAAQIRLLRAERIAAWRDIARRIAHEIKNPLMPIQTSIETIRKTHARKHPDFDEIFDESTSTVLEEVTRLKNIVTEFSRFARLPRPRPTLLSVNEVVEHVISLHHGAKVDMSAHLTSSPASVRADREQLTQVIVNLVKNALEAAEARHGDRGGSVKLTTEVLSDKRVVLHVVDNGPGIAIEDQSRIFEPYFTTKPDGTGLGLAITHRIVNDHGGEIDVQTAAEGGAHFKLTLRPEGPRQEIEASLTH